METAIKSGCIPPPEFLDDARDPLVKLKLTDSTELWLIQWPKDHSPDLDGQQVSLDLNGDGELGNFRVSPGKSYKVVSYAYQEPDATVFASSGSESKIVGKISRRVSLIHYPDSSEVPKHNSKTRKVYDISSATSLTNSANLFQTPTKSIRPKNSQSPSENRTSTTHGSGNRSTLTVEKEPSKFSIRRNKVKETREHSRATKSKRSEKQ